MVQFSTIRQLPISAVAILLLAFCWQLPCHSQLPTTLTTQTTGSKKASAEQKLKLGDAYLRSNILLSAAIELEKAVELYKAIGDSTGTRLALTNLGFVYYRQSNYDRALQVFIQAESIPGKINDRGNLLAYQGLVYLELGEYQRALVNLQQASGNQIQDIVEYNRNRIGQGEAYRYLGWYAQALQYLQAALRVAGDRTDNGRAMNAIGDVYFDLGQYWDALDYYQQAVYVLLIAPIADILPTEEKDKVILALHIAGMNDISRRAAKPQRINL